VKVKKKSGKWYGRVPGSPKPTPLSTNKVAAQQILAELVKKAELGRAGILDPFEAHRRRPLTEHLDEWQASLLAGGATAKHVCQTAASARRIVAGSGSVRRSNDRRARTTLRFERPRWTGGHGSAAKMSSSTARRMHARATFR